MPYRPKDIYRGRRKFRVPLTILLFVLAFVLVGGVTMFFLLQRFMVYDANGATLQLPFLSQTEAPDAAGAALPTPTYEPVQVQVIWEDPDFADVDLGGWQDLDPIQGWFYPLSTVTNAADLASAVNFVKDSSYTTAVFEMKDRSGQLGWASANSVAIDYGTGTQTDIASAIATLHDADKTVAAQISCFTDTLMVQRNWTCALQNATGGIYQDSNGRYWVDPYNHTIRAYLEGLALELADMGFDEIILADLYHPVSENGFGYSTQMQTTPDPVVAVCQMGRRVAEALAGSGVAVSVRIDTDSLRDGKSSQTGQDIDIFWRLFSRLYCPTTIDMFASDREKATESMSGGDENIRFVPILGMAPEDSDSYVLTN